MPADRSKGGVDDMLSKKMQDALNGQLNAELYSGYLYLAMAAHFEAGNLPGFAHWMQVQAKEEAAHAMKFFDHINDRSGRVTLQAIETPQAKWTSPLAAFEAALKHEQHISGRIHALVNQAIGESDHATTAFLQWFVIEQVEEERSASEIVEKLKMVGDSPQGLLLIDRALADR
jgi:ferritin